MNRIFLYFFVCLILFSCSNKQKQLDNEKLILGDWLYINISNSLFQPPSLLIPGYTFYNDNTCEFKQGYFKSINDTSRYGIHSHYIGSTTKYTVSANVLNIYNLEINKWTTFQIIKLSTDSLKLEMSGHVYAYRHINQKKASSIKFDKIIVSSSDCDGPCPITNTMIDSDGTVIFNGIRYTTKNGFFTGNITKTAFKRIEKNFNRTNIELLNSRYETSVSDGHSITTTFVKQGKIYKTVYDYDSQAPISFRWLTAPFLYWYQTIPLNELNSPGFVPEQFGLYSAYKKKDSVLVLEQSEIFLLWDYLRKGKISNHFFKARFKLNVHHNINTSMGAYDTDGRYYTFINKGNPVTIDIGFNFYDVNAKMWKWRKATEYD